MPTYTYLCKDVHGEFEQTHSIKETLEECPKCKAENLPAKKVTRLISGGTGFVLTGGGWANSGYS